MASCVRWVSAKFKNEASRLLESVEREETLTITRRGHPVARVVPAGKPPSLQELIDAGRLSWTGRRPTLPEPIALTGDGPTAADIVIEDRGPR